MSFSNELIDKYKKIKEIKTDSEVAELIPEMNKGNLSKIRKGIENRHLNEKQALWIAEQCELDAKLVLVELAEECSKSEIAKHVWHEIAKKMRAAASVLALTGLLLVSSVSGGIYAQRRKYPIM
jgi:hypothetical protein